MQLVTCCGCVLPLIIVLIGITIFTLNRFGEEHVSVNVNLTTVFGPILGVSSVSREGRTFYKFTSIPYAKPPVGQLRFESPLPFGSWEGTLIRKDGEMPPACAQVDFVLKTKTGVEDCLYLNVFTPLRRNNHTDDGPLLRLPVMVFIHGGHFMFGSSALYNPEYFMDEDVVLVTLNYRLNALGFLNTEDGKVKGNMGLKDQSLALKWVKDAISDFGGDPDRVTIFGNSAGGSSVTFHMMSWMSKGLFHAAISQSGTNLCFWSTNKRPSANAKRFATRLHCPTDAEMVECLKSKPVEELMTLLFETLDILYPEEAYFLPSAEEASGGEDAFLTEPPLKVLQRGDPLPDRVPWMNGVTSDDGCIRSAIILNDATLLDAFAKDKIGFLSILIQLPRPQNDVLLQKVVDYYFPSGHDVSKEELMRNWTDLLSDTWIFNCGKDWTTHYMSQGAPIYSYYFTKRVDISYGHILEARSCSWLRPEASLPLAYLKYLFYHHVLGRTHDWGRYDYGACHTDELQLLFPKTKELTIGPTSPHFSFSREMVKLWVSFAGGSVGQFKGVEWKPQSNKEELVYLKLDEDEPGMISEPFNQGFEFWKSLL